MGWVEKPQHTLCMDGEGASFMPPSAPALPPAPVATARAPATPMSLASVCMGNPPRPGVFRVSYALLQCNRIGGARYPEREKGERAHYTSMCLERGNVERSRAGSLDANAQLALSGALAQSPHTSTTPQANNLIAHSFHRLHNIHITHCNTYPFFCLPSTPIPQPLTSPHARSSPLCSPSSQPARASFLSSLYLPLSSLSSLPLDRLDRLPLPPPVASPTAYASRHLNQQSNVRAAKGNDGCAVDTQSQRP